jgi:predicted metal-dependent phosphoesterase TrpH
MAVSGGFDFHIHTESSDGLHPARDVLRRAGEAGLRAISITDHDTVDAYRDLGGAGSSSAAGLPAVVPGVEVSTRFGEEEAHILGYFAAGISGAVEAWLEGIIEARRRRMGEAIRKLRERGLDVAWTECAAAARGRVVSRTHLASLLVAKRYVLRPARAYAVYLGRDTVPLPEPSAEDTVASISALGGLAVWAHPGVRSFQGGIDRLAGAGLSGVEVHTPRRKRADARLLLEAARSRGLLVTGGSDWHGFKPGPELGRFRVAAEGVGDFLARVLG